MAHPEGFEPPTKWFEATYSIQLSYGCVTSAYFNYFLVNSQRLIFTAQEILSSEGFHSIYLHPLEVLFVLLYWAISQRALDLIQ